MKKYSIVCGSRSGSSYLCDLLTGTNRCGKPQEFWNPTWKSWNGFTVNELGKDNLIRMYKTENEVFGSKIVGRPQLFDYLNSTIKTTHWIYLYREDEILQGISRFIADKTSSWHKIGQPPEYNKDAIGWYLEEVRQENAYFPEFLQDYDYLSLSYEKDLCIAPEQTIISILTYLDISTEEVPIKLSNKFLKPKEPNLTWKRRFLEENA